MAIIVKSLSWEHYPRGNLESLKSAGTGSTFVNFTHGYIHAHTHMYTCNDALASAPRYRCVASLADSCHLSSPISNRRRPAPDLLEQRYSWWSHFSMVNFNGYTHTSTLMQEPAFTALRGRAGCGSASTFTRSFSYCQITLNPFCRLGLQLDSWSSLLQCTTKSLSKLLDAYKKLVLTSSHWQGHARAGG